MVSSLPRTTPPIRLRIVLDPQSQCVFHRWNRLAKARVHAAERDTKGWSKRHLPRPEAACGRQSPRRDALTAKFLLQPYALVWSASTVGPKPGGGRCAREDRARFTRAVGQRGDPGWRKPSIREVCSASGCTTSAQMLPARARRLRAAQHLPASSRGLSWGHSCRTRTLGAGGGADHSSGRWQGAVSWGSPGPQRAELHCGKGAA
ncbi:uncharacterized protein LOC121142972 [Mesocricetus auratus]|uniref:Uncharacterized protein LOC121142972 n=1 Tax=Mesocricetus auratus TaxID=10036 RepID=A0ABM2Y5N3_MESAU|nr:uncharacterized protein LOC121142972 [Mesocricetus auratus]